MATADPPKGTRETISHRVYCADDWFGCRTGREAVLTLTVPGRPGVTWQAFPENDSARICSSPISPYAASKAGGDGGLVAAEPVQVGVGELAVVPEDTSGSSQ